MKTTAIGFILLLSCFSHQSGAQSTTGGQSGGSTASTGATYSTSDVRSPASSPASMTVADGGASSSYIIGKRVNPDRPKNTRAKSPDGTPPGRAVHTSRSASGKTGTRNRAANRNTRKTSPQP